MGSTQTFTNTGAVLAQPGGAFALRHWQTSAGPADVVVEVELTGVCGSDLHIWQGEWQDYRFPLLLGHEIVGKIVAAPNDTIDQRGHHLQAGDRVVLSAAYYSSCGHCYACQQLQAPWACAHRPADTIDSGDGSVHVFGGGFSKYLVIEPPHTRHLMKINAPAEVAVLHEPLSVVVTAIMESPQLFGSQVVVQGTGSLGLLSVLAAKTAGASRVIAVGAPQGRNEFARELGADHIIDIGALTDAADRIDRVRELTRGGWGADVVFDWTGAVPAFTEGLAYLRPGGTLMEGGTVAADTTANVDPSLIWRNDLRVAAVRGSTATHFSIAADLLEQHGERLRPLVTHRYGLHEVHRVFAALAAGFEHEGRTVVKAAVDLRDIAPSAGFERE